MIHRNKFLCASLVCSVFWGTQPAYAASTFSFDASHVAALGQTVGKALIAGASSQDKTDAVSAQDKNFVEALSTCDGRLDVLENTQAKQLKREESLTIWGLVLGSLGGLSTVTNVARGLSTAAGLAPSVAKVWTDSGDSSGATATKLQALNKKITDDAAEYMNVSIPVDGDPNFNANLGARQKALLKLSVDCISYRDTTK